MDTTRLAIALLLSMIGFGCGGGSGAALQVQPFPGDAQASGRRLESLARQFENEFPCTAEDTIQIVGLAPGVYSASGCNAMRDYQLGCRPGPYGQICDWQAMADFAQQAGVDLNCGPQYIDVQQGAPGQRSAEGCGFRAVYMLQCGAGCGWVLSGPIQQSAPGTTGGGSYTY